MKIELDIDFENILMEVYGKSGCVNPFIKELTAQQISYATFLFKKRILETDILNKIAEDIYHTYMGLKK